MADILRIRLGTGVEDRADAEVIRAVLFGQHGLLDGLRASGLQAPEALSLVGFDDANYADFTQPRISTIRQPARELGRTAVNIMMRLLNDDPDIPAETRLPVEWIGRDSIKIC